MFETVFQKLDDGALSWPVVALLLFMVVFFAQLARILRAPRSELEAQARLPLAEDVPPRCPEEARR